MKHRFVVVICLVLSLLCGCGQSGQPSKEIYSENELYKMYKEDGKWYIEFLQPADGEDSNAPSNNNIAITYPQFDSAIDLANMLKSGNIPDEYIRVLRSGKSNNVLEISDPNKICDLKMPNSLEYKYVSWHGDAYHFEIEKEDFIGYIDCYDVIQDQYTRKFEEYQNFPNENHTVTSDITVEDRNARIVYSYTSTCEQKNILYKITAGKSEIYVRETYVIQNLDDELTFIVSDTIPYTINVWGSDETHYWHGWFMGFKERPSVEWLSSFRLVPIE